MMDLQSCFLGREKMIFLSPRRVSPFLAWGDFHVRSRFARSTIPEDKWGTTRVVGVAFKDMCSYVATKKWSRPISDIT